MKNAFLVFAILLTSQGFFDRREQTTFNDLRWHVEMETMREITRPTQQPAPPSAYEILRDRKMIPGQSQKGTVDGSRQDDASPSPFEGLPTAPSWQPE